MDVIRGKGVFGAIAIGTIFYYRRSELQIVRENRPDTEREKERFETAKELSMEQLSDLHERAVREVGKKDAQIFEVHQMLIADAEYQDAVLHMIESQQVNAEYAVSAVADNLSAVFSAMDDEYMKARAADIQDISDRLIGNLCEKKEYLSDAEGRYIVCADDLSPSETINLDKEKVLAFVTRYGSISSHTAILARTMNIPAVIGAGDMLTEELDGKFAAVDGFTGKLYIEPDEVTVEALLTRQQNEQAKKDRLQRLKGKETITIDGTKIKVCANIGTVQDVDAVIANDAEGIGLFRSEFLYFESEDYPTEETQFAVYKKVLESMPDQKVVIRTMDIGADKQMDYFQLDKEENPALGYRAIRICLTRPEVFRVQLRALLRASVYGQLAILFPMITSLEEVREIKEILAGIKRELDGEGLAYSENVEIGIMIETPAAAVLSDVLAPEVDFFSVGTNDLTQYTLAIDRQNPKLDRFYNPHHEAILRLIEYAALSAHKHGKWIGICGELGADTELTRRWLEMGIDELSVAPSYVLTVREKVRKTNLNVEK